MLEGLPEGSFKDAGKVGLRFAEFGEEELYKFLFMRPRD